MVAAAVALVIGRIMAELDFIHCGGCQWRPCGHGQRPEFGQRPFLHIASKARSCENSGLTLPQPTRRHVRRAGNWQAMDKV